MPQRDYCGNYGAIVTEKMLLPPLIPDTKGSGARPYWSVMIPTYNARADYLEEALRSVLQQDPGPKQMQIEVVDDCSPHSAPVKLVHRIAGDRVAVHREPKNNGLAGIWNRCIERARGEWVHILHQDDVMFPGFYASLHGNIKNMNRVGAAFCRGLVMDDVGSWLALGDIERPTAGMLDGWLPKICESSRILCSSIVVRRQAYEVVGGFRRDLCFALDWEMWCRLAREFEFWYEPRVMCAYRTHKFSTTSQLAHSGIRVRDTRNAISIITSYLPPRLRQQIAARTRVTYALAGFNTATALISKGKINEGLAEAWESLKCSQHFSVVRRALLFCFWVLRRVFGRLLRARSRLGKDDASYISVETRE